MGDQKNMLIAIALSLAILLGFQFFYEFPRMEQERARQAEIEAQQQTQPDQPRAPDTALVPDGVPVASDAEVSAAQRRATIESVPRIGIDTPTIRGSIALTGARIDDIVLKNYRYETDPDSDNIRLLNPKAALKSYYAEFGWVGDSTSPVGVLPSADTQWTADRAELTPQTPVTLTWDNGDGLVFEQELAIDADYMLTVSQRVRNSSDSAITLYPYSLISRSGTPDTIDFYILHEGPLGVFDGRLSEFDYDDLQDSTRIEERSVGGWIGITDKYWLAALVPNQDEMTNYRFVHSIRDADDRYQVDALGPPSRVEPGQTVSASGRLFAGAKEVRLLDHYSETFGIANFDLAVDFGWFYFLTKPFFFAVSWLAQLLGNYGLAILAFTVLVKAVFFPLANRSYRSMAKMRSLMPKLKALQEQYGDDKQRKNQEMMALYKQEKVNPASGCLPILLQIPVFFALYKVLFVSIEMRHAPFYGWIRDLSVADPTSIFNGFGLIPWTPPDFLIIGIWPVLMGLTMWLQQRLNPQPTDPVQARIFAFLPLVFTFVLGSFPAGLVIYWTWNNLLSIAQQKLIMWRMGVQ